MPSDFSLTDRVVLVTGASRGIGEAIARACARAGAAVVLAARKQEGLDAVAAAIRDEGGVALPVACHVGKPEQVESLFARAGDELGVVDGLVNNAATNVYFGPMLGITDAAWDKIFEVNLKGSFSMIRAFAQQSAGRGSIVNVASVYGMRAAPLQGVYGMTKAAVISMTKTLAQELGPAGIRVNAIAPGLVETRFAAALVEDEELRSRFTDRTATGRHAQPEEIGAAAVYLLSESASFTTGSVVTVDGGMTAT